MTLSLYSTCKAWRRDAAARRTRPSGVAGAPSPSGQRTALTLFGLGVGGIAAGGDQAVPDTA